MVAKQVLTHDDAMKLCGQVEHLAELFDKNVVRAKDEIQTMCDPNTSSGRFVIHFGESWNAAIEELKRAMDTLVSNNDTARDNYGGTLAASQQT